MTRDQLIALAAAFGPSVLQGIGQGGQASADRALTEQDRARQAEQELYRRRQAGRADLTGFYQNQLNRDINAAGDFAAQSPLGAEQLLARNMARMRQVGQAAGQYRPPTGMSPAASAFAAQQPNFLAPFASADFQQTVSPEATARSIAERRKALAAIDPNFQFGSMSDFGLPSLDTEVAQYQGGVRDRRQTSENEQLRLLTEQMREASASQIPGATGATTPGTAATGATADKKPSLLRRIAGAALPVAAAFIPGVGPVASALIQAGAGAAGSALAGGGLKGALTGAAMGGLGAATGGLGSAAARKVAGEGMGSFVQRAILDPRALTQIAGGTLGGGVGAGAQLASLGMDRIEGNTGQKLLNQYVDPEGRLRQIDPSLRNRPLESIDSTLSAFPGMRVGGVLQADAERTPSPQLQTAAQLMAQLPGMRIGDAAATAARPTSGRRPAQRQPAAPEAAPPLSLDRQRELERSMSRRELQALPPTALTREGQQRAYGPVPMQMLGSAEGRPSAEEVLEDMTQAAILLGVLSRFLPPSMLRAAGATGATTVTGQAVRNMPRMLPSGARSPLRLPGGATRPALPGTQSIPLPNGGGVLTRDVGSPFFRLPGGGIMYR